ncbi:MAG: S8 family serine peptidase, partial [Pseudomonadota bacterium]
LFLVLVLMGGILLKIPDVGSAHSKNIVEPAIVPNELIVKFKHGVSRQEIDEINLKKGTSVFSVNHKASFMRLRIHGKGKGIQTLIREYRQNNKVEYAEPNYIVHTTMIPNDTQFSQLWGLHNTGQTGGVLDADIDAPEAWDNQTGNSSVVVGVIDTGVDYNHEDLAANIWFNPGEIAGNGIDDDGNGFTDDINGWDFLNNDNDPIDDNSHGTHVAGIIGAVGDNGSGVVGVNWSVQIMPLKFLGANGSGTTADAIEAIQYATMMGVKILNNSWGSGGFSQALRDAIIAANEAGVLFVAAAGNDGSNNDVTPFYPASYYESNILAVAATDHNDNLASFSNYGFSAVDLGAPGVNILSTTLNNTYGFKNGTSMAAPFVSGVAALFLAEYSDLTHDEVKVQLLNSVEQLTSLKEKVLSRGRLNVNNALLGIGPPVPSIIFYDDMENGINGWTVSGETSLWHQTNNRFASPITSWYYGNEGTFNYDTGGRNFGFLTSPSIALTNIQNATLLIKHYLDTEEIPSFDQATVRISNDGGVSFTDLITKLTTKGTFAHEAVDIAAFDGEIIQIQFFFDTVDNISNQFEGWSVDDVVIMGQEAVLPNEPPVANAGTDQSVNDTDGNGSELVTLDGYSSYDADGEIVYYEWKEGETILGSSAIITSSFAVGEHTVVLTVTDNESATDTDIVQITVTPAPSPGPTVHVSNIELTLAKKGSKYNAKASIGIVDDGDKSVNGALVTGQWELNGTFIKQVSKESNKKGVVSLDSGKVSAQSGDVFTITIMDVSKDGFSYDSARNVETSDSITVP